jgi:hypothetical protein
VQQPCELHVWRTPVVIPRQPCLSIRCHSPRRPTPRSRSYATFVWDQELQQARAEMEECYRRRAKRAGLEDTLPVGRPMMEEEIKDLQ